MDFLVMTVQRMYAAKNEDRDRQDSVEEGEVRGISRRTSSYSIDGPLDGMRAAIARERYRLQRLVVALEGMRRRSTEEAVFQELADAFKDIFSVPLVRVLRYDPGKKVLEVLASIDDCDVCCPPVEADFPHVHFPHHIKALTRGQASLLERDKVQESGWKFLYPKHVERVLVLPVPIDTHFHVALSADVTGGEIKGEPLLDALVHVAELAWERVDLSRRLQATQEEMEWIFTNSSSGLLVLSPDLVVIRANPAAAALWNLSVDEMAGLSAQELFGSSFLDLVRISPEGETHLTWEFPILTRSGKTRNVLVSVVFLPKEGREDRHYLVTLVDVTEQRRLERLRRQMITNVTHEMRTPLAVIKGYVEILERDEYWGNSEVRREALTMIQQRVDDLLRMVDMHLYLAALESREVSPVRERVVVEDLVRAVWNERKSRYGEVPIFNLDIAESARAVCVDISLLEHVLRHLLDNALKFTPPEGQIRVEVNRDNRAMRIRVIDTGVGISEEDLPHIFESFYRGANAGYGVPGSGLGLALVQAVVAYMGGTISVHSEEGRGTVVELTLPGVMGPDAPNPPANLRSSER